MHILCAMIVTELNLSRKTMESVTVQEGRILQSLPGRAGHDGVKHIDKDEKEGMALHAYFGCVSCNRIQYIDKDEEEGKTNKDEKKMTERRRKYPLNCTFFAY